MRNSSEARSPESWRRLLPPAVRGNPPIDGESGFVLICAYTGKEVV